MQDLIFFISHNLLLVAAWFIVVFLLIAFEIRTRIFGPKKLSTAELVQLVNHNDAKLYDIRSHAEFEKGHISQAVNIKTTEIERELKSAKNDNQSVIIVCKDGIQSSQEAFRLKSTKIIKEVGYLQGGILTWESEKLPTVTD